jgi:SAM-dependent methyltransferase
VSLFEGIDVAGLAEDVLQAARDSKTEEDLKIRVVRLLGDILIKSGIRWEEGRYEYTLVSGARADALYGHLIIEYERPGTFESKPGANFNHAIEQLKRYISNEARSEKSYEEYFGVALDGFRIGFIRFRKNQWLVQGPFDVNKYTLMRVLEALRGLRKKLLEVDLLVKDLGPQSEVARKSIQVFYQRIKSARANRTKVLFEDWRRVFSQVCAYSPEKIAGLEETYGIHGKKVDVAALLFAVHTYYALLMKLLAAEIAVLFGDSLVQSFMKKLEGSYYKGPQLLKAELVDLENGGVFSKLGITNFMEADYFGWYLDEWNIEIAAAIIDLVKVLTEYEPATAELEPERVKDLFKRLYQNLVSRETRHGLGEYYTPDWLAELLMDEAGLTLEKFEGIAQEKSDSVSPLRIRVLDPACGSGTFLVLAIKRMKDYADAHFVKDQALPLIIKNIVGFDLNPLAVMASRANYLIALGDLLRYRGASPMEIPVYLADSILVERKSSLHGIEYLLRTTVGQFSFPVKVVNTGYFSSLLGLIEECLRLDYPTRDFADRLRTELPDIASELRSILALYSALLKLEKTGRNRIWVRLMKNSFAPLFAGRFDYVLGNPPWINWANLPQEYRESTLNLWRDYGLISESKSIRAEVKKDLAMLFVTVSVTRYLAESGILSFLVPYTFLKTPAGAGLRVFLKNRCNVRKLHDLVELLPFENAINRTAMIVLSKGTTTFPVESIVWSKSVPGEIPFDASLEEVINNRTMRYAMQCTPIGGVSKPETSWLIVRPKAMPAIQRALGRSLYEAHSGVDTGANSVYWMEIVEQTKTRLTIRNLSDIGKKKLKEVVMPVEKELVFPLLRGRDVARWISRPSGHILVPHEIESGYPIRLTDCRTKFSKAFAYFSEFRSALEKRGTHKMMGEGKPFYAVYKIGNYTFSPHKVVWKEIAGRISGKGLLIAAMVSASEDPVLGIKTVIPDHKLMFMSFKSEEEANYVCAVLNSSLVRLIVASYIIETSISTRILNDIRIGSYDPSNILHTNLAKLSKQAHQAASRENGEVLTRIEKEIDTTISHLYGLSEDEAKEVLESLDILLGHEPAVDLDEEDQSVAVLADDDNQELV